MHVLYVAFYFPPTSGGGVERTLRFCEHLPAHGVTCEVVAPDDARWLAEDPASLARIPDGLRVHRVHYRGLGNRVLPADRIAAATGTLERARVRARLAPRRVLLPDADLPWLVDLVPAATRLLRSGRFDALLTTAPPHSVTVAGSLLARRTGLPWVADWRDPWLAHPDVARDRPAVRAKLAASARLARRVAPRMAGAACVNEAIADEVRRLAPGAVVDVIPNGAEVEQIAALERHPAARMTFTFTGYFFGDRGPGAFLDGLAGALRERPALRDGIRTRFIGGFPEAERARLRSLGVEDVVEVEPTQPHDVVLQAPARRRRAAPVHAGAGRRRGGRAGEDVGVPRGRAAGAGAGAPYGAAAREIARPAPATCWHPATPTASVARILALAARHDGRDAGGARAQPGCAGADIASWAGGATGRFAAAAAR